MYKKFDRNDIVSQLTALGNLSTICQDTSELIIHSLEGEQSYKRRYIRSDTLPS